MKKSPGGKGGEGEFYQREQREVKGARKGPVRRAGVWLGCEVCK